MAGTLIPVAQASSNLVIPKNQYQGALAAAPTVRTNGTALQDGDLYFNTTTIEMLVYDATGTAWVGTATSVSAATSAAAALVSENNAATSATNAATSETNAAVSAATIPSPTALDYIRGNAGGTAYEARTPAQVAADIGSDLKEDGLGNPLVDGHVLSSTIAGVRSWASGGSAGALDMPVVAKSAAYTALLADKGKALNCTGTWTLGLTAAATVGDGWTLAVNNRGTGLITVGTLNIRVAPSDSVLIGCDGTNFFIIARTQFGVIDRTGITTAATMDIGEKWKIDFTAAANVPLYCTTADGQEYRLSIAFTNASPTTADSLELHANDTTYAGAFRARGSYSVSNTPSAITTLIAHIQLGVGTTKGGLSALISTATTRKMCVSNFSMNHTTAHSTGVYGSYWEDSTTLWTSLGTIHTASTETLDGSLLLERIK